MIQQAILAYIDHPNDWDYLAQLVASTDTQDLIAAVVALLESGDPEQVHFTCVFVRDMVLGTHAVTAFRDAFDTSSIIPALERLAITGQWQDRRNAVYTLGKVCSRASVPALLRAFDQHLERDPLLLGSLVGEIGWLKYARCDVLIERMAMSRQFTTRWAALELLDEGWLTEKSFNQRWLEHLCQDEHPLVRTEAEHKLRCFEFDQWRVASGASRAEKRQRRKVLDSQQPTHTFEGVRNRFSNALSFQGQADYTVAELEEFIARLMDE